jgi:hypothetical protein
MRDMCQGEDAKEPCGGKSAMTRVHRSGAWLQNVAVGNEDLIDVEVIPVAVAPEALVWPIIGAIRGRELRLALLHEERHPQLAFGGTVIVMCL